MFVFFTWAPLDSTFHLASLRPLFAICLVFLYHIFTCLPGRISVQITVVSVLVFNSSAFMFSAVNCTFYPIYSFEHLGPVYRLP